MVDGKIAPNSLLYADFVIDPTGSEVAIDYSFSLGSITSNGSETIPTSRLKVADVRLISSSSVDATNDHSEGTQLTGSSGVYTGTINLNPATGTQNSALTASEAQTVRVYIQWQETNVTADNTADTAVGIESPTLTMTVTGTATQKVS